MSTDYIESLFDIMDGKVTYNNVGKKKRGRKPGYRHSPETKEKIANQMRDRVKTEEVKQKISQSLQGVPKPESTRRKISKSKRQNNPNPHNVASDLLNIYSGLREKDIPTPTIEFIERSGHSKAEICKWIKDHQDEINSFEYDEYDNEEGDICSESRLKEGFYKGSPIEQDILYFYEELYNG